MALGPPTPALEVAFTSQLNGVFKLFMTNFMTTKGKRASKSLSPLPGAFKAAVKSDGW